MTVLFLFFKFYELLNFFDNSLMLFEIGFYLFVIRVLVNVGVEVGFIYSCVIV